MEACSLFSSLFKFLVVLSVHDNRYFSQEIRSFKTPLSYYSWTPQSSHRDTFFLYLYILFFLQNELLPPSQCMPSQTLKMGMGPLDRKHLLDHLKKQAQVSKILNIYTHTHTYSPSYHE